MSAAPQDRWASLRALTAARIGLARAGSAIATRDHLAFQAAHAQARDAVASELDAERLASGQLCTCRSSALVHPWVWRALQPPATAHA